MRTAKMTPTEGRCLDLATNSEGKTLFKSYCGLWRGEVVNEGGWHKAEFSTQTVQRLVARGLGKMVDGTKFVLTGVATKKFAGYSETFYLCVTNGDRLPGVPSPLSYAILNEGGTKELVRSSSSLIWGTASSMLRAAEMAASIPADGHPVAVYECRRVK